MFHKIKDITALCDFNLRVQFCEGITKIYDMNPLINKYDLFNVFKSNSSLFYDVEVDIGGYGAIWNDDLDISCDELWEGGITEVTRFTGLIALSDATTLWCLNESTLRKAISYGKLINGIDVCKFGKQWVISYEAMQREYGEPKLRK